MKSHSTSSRRRFDDRIRPVRTHTCVGAAHAGGTVRVAGWVHRRRDHGGLIFVDLRDRSGIVQLVFDPEAAPEAHAAAHRFHNEDVVSVVGAVTARDAKNVNPNIATGAVEVRVEQVELLSAADPLPFSVEDEIPGGERGDPPHLPLHRDATAAAAARP